MVAPLFVWGVPSLAVVTKNRNNCGFLKGKAPPSTFQLHSKNFSMKSTLILNSLILFSSISLFSNISAAPMSNDVLSFSSDEAIYQLFSGRHATSYEQAKSICEATDSKLALVHDIIELDLISDALRNLNVQQDVYVDINRYRRDKRCMAILNSKESDGQNHLSVPELACNGPLPFICKTFINKFDL